MTTPTPLLDRIEGKYRKAQVIELRKQPRWIERMQRRPAKDMTGYIRPEGPDAA